jgi:hypothetical protein
MIAMLDARRGLGSLILKLVSKIGTEPDRRFPKADRFSAASNARFSCRLFTVAALAAVAIACSKSKSKQDAFVPDGSSLGDASDDSALQPANGESDSTTVFEPRDYVIYDRSSSRPCGSGVGPIIALDDNGPFVKGLLYPDLDGDGVDEIVFADCGEGACIVRGGDIEAALNPIEALDAGNAWLVAPLDVERLRIAGDMNGDGLVDLAFIEVTIPEPDYEETLLHIKYGQWPWTGDGVVIELGRRLRYEIFWSLEVVGDLDAKGQSDLLLSSTYNDYGGGSRSRLIRGERLAEGRLDELLTMDPDDTVISSDDVGFKVVDDFNGDGFLDLAIAVSHGEGGVYPCPAVAILWGPVPSETIRLSAEFSEINDNGREVGSLAVMQTAEEERPVPGVWIVTGEAYRISGAPLIAAGGDFDGDGYQDLVVEPSDIDNNFIYIVHGEPDLTDMYLYPESPTEGVTRIDISSHRSPYRSLMLLGMVPRCGANTAPADLLLQSDNEVYWIQGGSRGTITLDEAISIEQAATRKRERCLCRDDS